MRNGSGDGQRAGHEAHEKHEKHEKRDKREARDGRGGDPLAALERAGFPLHALPEEQLQVFRELSPAEVALLLDLKERLDAAEPEVMAHQEIAGGALF